jgi:hypothetical protein
MYNIRCLAFYGFVRIQPKNCTPPRVFQGRCGVLEKVLHPDIQYHRLFGLSHTQHAHNSPHTAAVPTPGGDDTAVAAVVGAMGDKQNLLRTTMKVHAAPRGGTEYPQSQ